MSGGKRGDKILQTAVQASTTRIHACAVQMSQVAVACLYIHPKHRPLFNLNH